MTEINCDEMHTFIDLYNFLLTHKSSSGIKKWLSVDWKGRDKQESLLRLFAGLGVIDKLKHYNICKGNFNLNTISIHESKRDVFYCEDGSERNLKDKGDSSDLTGIHERDSKNILVTTSKNLTSMNIGDLDVAPILVNFEKYGKVGYTMTLCVCVRDVNKYNAMKSGVDRTSQDSLDYLNKADTIVIDWEDLNQAYYMFKEAYYGMEINDLCGMKEKPICFQMHQFYTRLKTTELKNSGKKRILWGHIPRSGKSYIIAGCIIDDSYGKDKCNYLVITTAPKETMDQQISRFNCSQLNDFKVIKLNGDNKNPALSNKNIIVCSKQFLQGKIGKSSIKELEKLRFDMRFVDESHNGGTTELAQNILNTYGKDSCTVMITATYSKPANDYNIPSNSWVLWDVEDVKMCQNLKTVGYKERLVRKHGKTLEQAINICSIDNIVAEYKAYPDLWILTDEISKDVVKEIMEMTKNNSYGWSTEACFLLKQGLNSESGMVEMLNEFQNEEEALKVWYKIFGKKGNYGIIEGDPKKVFMTRIKSICNNSEINSRFLGKGDPLVIMCFLPQDNIDKISSAAETLLRKNNVIPDYEIVCINSKTTSNPKDLINENVIKARNNGKSGVLVLSGRQCSLGVTIDNCDVVLLMNNNTSFDMIFQMMYRCMTPGNGKRCGFVVDLNIQRAIKTSIVEYGGLSVGSGSQDATKYLLQERIITLNGDHWMPSFGKHIDKHNEMIENVYKIYNSDIVNALSYYLNHLKFKKLRLTSEEQNSIKDMIIPTRPAQNQNTRLNNDTVNNGIERERSNSGSERSSSSGSDSESAPPANTENVEDTKYMNLLRHIVPLVCLLTINDNDGSLNVMFNKIKGDEYLSRILLKQMETWWGQKIEMRTMDNFINIYIKYTMNDAETKQIISTVKDLFSKSLGNMNELSQLVDKYFIPQELERQSNGEVSTPYKLRQEMLDKVPGDFWESPRTVFEPCVGKGGFLIDIVQRFMKGLEKKIPDEKKRYKKIVEECVYFCDINPTNIYICKLLLNPDNKRYKLKYHEGNTLVLDINNKWGLTGFDAIIGNPPYNNELWADFVDYSLNKMKEDAYLLYVHPCNWRKPGHVIGNKMKKNDIIYLKMYTIKDTSSLFNCNVRVDWYLLQKRNTDIYTTIDDDMNILHEIKVKNMEFIPNNLINIINKIISKTDIEKLNIIRNHKIVSNNKNLKINKTDVYKYGVLTNLSSKEKRIKYTDTPVLNVYNKPKVMMSYSLNLYPFYDEELSPTEHVFYQIVNDKRCGMKLISYLDSKLFKAILKSFKWIGFQTDHKVFPYIPNVINSIENINDTTLYNFFGLTDDEILLVESIV